MKICVKIDPAVPSQELHLHCREVTGEVEKILSLLKSRKIWGKNAAGEECTAELSSIYYFESVEKRVFAYTEDQVLELRCRLYELEESCPRERFFRISKTTLVNLEKICRIRPEEGRRLKTELRNGEWLLVSRSYAGAFLKQLKEGLK